MNSEATMNIADRARRVRWWTAGSMVAIVLLLVTVSIGAFAITGQRNSVDIADDVANRIGERTGDLIAGELDDAVEALDLIDELVDDASLVDPSDSIDRILAGQVAALPQLAGAYIGFPDGTFRYVRRTDDSLVLKRISVDGDRLVTEAVLGDSLVPGPIDVIADDTYDPASRPWFELADASDSIVWTEPYVFFSSGRAGVTAAVARRTASGSLRAVIGVDLELGRLAAFIDDLPIDASAEAFIVADDLVVAAPDAYEIETSNADGSVSLATLGSLGISEALGTNAVETGDGARAIRVEMTGERRPDWAVVIRTDRVEFVEAVRRQSRIALAATTIAGVLLLIATALFAVWLRRPIEELSTRARLDPLTGVRNRQTLLEDGERLLKRAEMDDSEIVVAVIDIDDFKAVNDRHGHAAGDAALDRLGRALRLATRPTDVTGRLGGDEFVAVVRDADDDEAESMLDRLRSTAERQLGADGPTARATVTIGATARSGRRITLAELIREADEQLLSGKRTGKDTIRWARRPRSHVGR